MAAVETKTEFGARLREATFRMGDRPEMMDSVPEQPSRRRIRWTNPSVRAFAGDRDPVGAVLETAREKVFEALERGWSGPPYDPFVLADSLGVPVVPMEEVEDARLIHRRGRPRIEFNPNRGSDRVRFSVAHELGHLLFPDASDRIRFRSHGEDRRNDDWQLELLCNLAAAEFLMPTGSFSEQIDQDLGITYLGQVREEFQVSMEALLLRTVRLTDKPIAMFAAAREDESREFRIDYLIGSRAWAPRVTNKMVRSLKPLRECTAVGYSASGEILLDSGPASIECLGVPPYPGSRYPRIVGLIRPDVEPEGGKSIRYVHGDATSPRGESGRQIVAHIVNDKARNWSPNGFAAALGDAYPNVRSEFSEWSQEGENLILGNVHFAEASDGVWVCSMVAQRGYGERASQIPLRYSALDSCLDRVAQWAVATNAELNMPLIGTGQARGEWSVVEEMIERRILSRDVGVTVYLLPGAVPPRSQTVQLGFHI